jgi:hypothetical protein
MAASTTAAAVFPLTAAGRDILSQLSLGPSGDAAPEPLPGGPFFLTRSFTDTVSGNEHDLYAIASAICDRILPADALGPGASAAGAVNSIDLFMAAFQPNLLASGLVNTSPIYLSGPFSGRWPYGDSTDGEPGPPSADAFENTGGQIQFLGLTPTQALSWYLRIYGSAPPGIPSWVSSAWLNQVTGASPLIPGARNLRSLYQEGLSAFDDWSKQNYGTGFAESSKVQQDVLLLLASNPVLAAASENGLPALPPPLLNPLPPPAAASLFGVIVLHTIQGTYCLPEYNGRSDEALGGQVTWASIGWEGDTQPLGNSIYDESLTENHPAEPENRYTNDGFGEAGIYQPTGAYREFRPVSHPDFDADGTKAVLTELRELIRALERAAARVTVLGGGTSSGKAGR